MLVLHILNPNAPPIADMVAVEMARSTELAVYMSEPRSFTDDPRDAEAPKINKVA
jgi:hypothetical protein